MAFTAANILSLAIQSAFLERCVRQQSTHTFETMQVTGTHAAVRRSRRSWKPNVQNKKLFSGTYQRFLQFRMTTCVIKEVKQLPGGIDEYLCRTPNSGLLYPQAVQIKRNLLRCALPLRGAARLPERRSFTRPAPVQARPYSRAVAFPC